jgi:hypothetical protein
MVSILVKLRPDKTTGLRSIAKMNVLERRCSIYWIPISDLTQADIDWLAGAP